MQCIPYGRQHIDSSDIDAVIEVLKSDWLTQGPAVDRFEAAISECCSVKHAVAVSNATAALHIACLAIGLTKGDTLWTSPNTFVASANCALYCGAEVDFVDIDPCTYNMSPELLAEKLEVSSRAGRLPKAIVPVHFSGQSCDLERIGALARQYDVRVIEDASHAVGAMYGCRPVGSCEFSDIAVFSFHPVKIITTGEGGVALTNSATLSERLRLFRSHGITRDAKCMSVQPEGEWYYEQVDLGCNYRITDLQAALGRSQLCKVQKFVQRRRELVRRYNKAFAGLPVQTPTEIAESNSAWHLYVLRLKGVAGSRRAEVFRFLRSAGVLVNVHYIPVHLQPYYRERGFAPGDFPNAEAYYKEAISLPLFYDLSDAQQDYVIEKVKEALA